MLLALLSGCGIKARPNTLSIDTPPQILIERESSHIRLSLEWRQECGPPPDGRALHLTDGTGGVADVHRAKEGDSMTIVLNEDTRFARAAWHKRGQLGPFSKTVSLKKSLSPVED